MTHSEFNIYKKATKVIFSELFPMQGKKTNLTQFARKALKPLLAVETAGNHIELRSIEQSPPEADSQKLQDFNLRSRFCAFVAATLVAGTGSKIKFWA